MENRINTTVSTQVNVGLASWAKGLGITNFVVSALLSYGVFIASLMTDNMDGVVLMTFLAILYIIAIIILGIFSVRLSLKQIRANKTSAPANYKNALVALVAADIALVILPYASMYVYFYLIAPILSSY